MEGLGLNLSFWKDKKVFITGHTGFKGGWITLWLSELGASVYGYSLEPSTIPNFFTETRLREHLVKSTFGDILDFESLTNALEIAKPDIIIHMAAQPLVLNSYIAPTQTFASNVMGTVNILEAARHVGTAKAIINITTDKCYENKDWVWSYRENDRLGGFDPYSASKACAEIAANAYRKSFLEVKNIHLASVRAGNVIGGGDWAADRLIPDFLRAQDKGEKITVRSPSAIRPWQHVLEPLSGYLLLAEKLYTEGNAFAESWNFGPNDEDTKSVSWILDKLCSLSPGVIYKTKNHHNRHESKFLKIDSSKAKIKLNWKPRWNVEIALKNTIEWHKAWQKNNDMSLFSSEQIRIYSHL